MSWDNIDLTTQTVCSLASGAESLNKWNDNLSYPPSNICRALNFLSLESHQLHFECIRKSTTTTTTNADVIKYLSLQFNFVDWISPLKNSTFGTVMRTDFNNAAGLTSSSSSMSLSRHPFLQCHRENSDWFFCHLFKF